MSRRIVAVVLAALVVGGLGGAVLFAVLGDDDDGRVAGPATTTTTTRPLNPSARELVDRLADVRDRDLHLVYTGALPAGEEGKLTIEVWWKGERTRQSLVAESPGQGRQESTAFVLADGNVFCQRRDTGPWSCQRGASTADVDASAGIIDALIASLDGKEVTSAAADVGGEDAECFTLDPTTGDVLCLRDDDVPVKFTFSGAELVLASAETAVDDADFRPPADVQSGTPSIPAPTTTPTTGG